VLAQSQPPVHRATTHHGATGDDDPALYQIRVNGHLSPTLLAAFPALIPQHRGTETVLTGLLPDSAALCGVLAELEALGLDLLEVCKVLPCRRPTGP
jgi:monoterpene epsilon-lactone hydrolase